MLFYILVVHLTGHLIYTGLLQTRNIYNCLRYHLKVEVFNFREYHQRYVGTVASTLDAVHVSPVLQVCFDILCCFLASVVSILGPGSLVQNLKVIEIVFHYWKINIEQVASPPLVRSIVLCWK